MMIGRGFRCLGSTWVDICLYMSVGRAIRIYGAFGFRFFRFFGGGDLVCPSLLGGFVSIFHIIPRTTKQKKQVYYSSFHFLFHYPKISAIYNKAGHPGP